MRGSKYEVEATYHSFPGPHSIFKSLFICIRILSGLDSLFTFTIRWYGSNLVSRQKVSRYTNTTNTSCRYTYKDLDCRHTINTLIAIMVCTSVSYAFRIKNGELYPVTKYTKFIISFLFLELLCVCNLYHIFMKYILCACRMSS